MWGSIWNQKKHNPKSNVEAEHKPLEKGDCSGKINQIVHLCQGLNSHFFHIIGDGHQPNSRGLYTHYKDSLLKVGGFPSPMKRDNLDHGTFRASSRLISGVRKELLYVVPGYQINHVCWIYLPAATRFSS